MVSCLSSQGRKLRQREAEEMAGGQGDSGGDFTGAPVAKTTHSTARFLGQGLPDQGTRAHTLQLKRPGADEKILQKKRRGQWASVKPGCVKLQRALCVDG